MDTILESKLIIGARIKIGKEYSETFSFDEGQILELIEGHFEYDNGLYISDQTAPAIWDDGDFQSIYHLFGNFLGDFLDCEVLTPTP